MTFRGWAWQPDASMLDAVIEGSLAEPPRIGFVNDIEIMTARGNLSGAVNETDPSPRSNAGLPTIELILDMPGFAPDYFVTGGAHFASADLRAVLALPDDVVEYLPIDMRRCRSEAIARDYRLMHARLTRELIDLDRTPHNIGPVRRPDGTEHNVIMLAPEARQYWRENFVADAPLFRAAHSTALIVDDAVASRILAAGLSGMTFQDVTSDAAQERTMLRLHDVNVG